MNTHWTHRTRLKYGIQMVSDWWCIHLLFAFDWQLFKMLIIDAWLRQRRLLRRREKSVSYTKWSQNLNNVRRHPFICGMNWTRIWVRVADSFLISFLVGFDAFWPLHFTLYRKTHTQKWKPAFCICIRSKKHSMQSHKSTATHCWKEKEREGDRKALKQTHSRSIHLIFRTLNSIPYVYFVLAPYQCPLQYGWISTGPRAALEWERTNEWVRNDWNCLLLLPVTMAVFFIQLAHSFRLPLLAQRRNENDRRVYIQYLCGKRVCVCLCVCERVVNVLRESMLNVARVHLAEVSSVVLCTSSTTTVARAHSFSAV